MSKATLFLIEIEGKLYGYDSPSILRIDINQNKPKEYKIFIKSSKSIHLEYSEISYEKLESEINDEYIESIN